jgi:uncharacterized protein (DUF2147 family)
VIKRHLLPSDRKDPKISFANSGISGMPINAVLENSRPGASGRRSPLKQIGVFLALFGAAVSASRTVASAGIPQGVWLIDNEVAVQIFDCSNLLCGRILWLLIPRNPEGQLVRDKKNPQPTLRQRPLCGLTIFWALRPAGPDRWTDGWFYNPDDGDTYNISAELRSADTIEARIYLGVPLLGKTKTLHRVPHGTSNGWC